MVYQVLRPGGGREKAWQRYVSVKNETLDSALRRFKRTCQKAGVLAEARKHEHYEKPSVKRKKKSEAARNANSINTRLLNEAGPNGRLI